MVDLILRPSTLAPGRPWALQLRWHESLGETEYYTIARVSDHIADEIIRAGRASYLYDDKAPEGIDLKETIAALEAENARLRASAPVGEARWRPIAEADNGIAVIHDVGIMKIGHSYPAWVRDSDGRVYEAVYTDKGYWWDSEAESPVDPVEFMPHPLDPRFTSHMESKG